MRIALAVVATLAALFLLGLIVVYSGCYNIAATAGHSGLERWALQTTQENSIRAHADAEEATVPDLSDPERIQHGAAHYEAMCVVCHGAPGVERGEIGKGITPTPPELSQAVRAWSPEEEFWIVKHGIKLAGMPAFGVTHTDEELWGIVAFIERLQGMTPEEYQAAVAEAGGHHRGGGGGEGSSAAEPSAAEGEDGGHTHTDGGDHTH